MFWVWMPENNLSCIMSFIQEYPLPLRWISHWLTK